MSDTPHSVPQSILAKDGKEMLLIPAGDFLVGANQQTAHLPAFLIDRYPVTNAEYKVFVEATRHDFPSHWRKGEPPAGKENHPVVQVNWFDAEAYARWAGKRLPTAAEWEKAARGTDGRAYPWGQTFQSTYLNCGVGGPFTTTPVGQYSPQGDSPYGLVDMAGNVYEWTNDGNPVTTMGLRGGSWLDGPEMAYTYVVRKHTPRRKNDFIGFRCVMDAPQDNP
jgi:formylglycine-generating enzyme required for sulfatase activity